MEKDKRQEIYEIHRLAKAICERVDHPIVLVCNGEVQHRRVVLANGGEDFFADVW